MVLLGSGEHGYCSNLRYLNILKVYLCNYLYVICLKMDEYAVLRDNQWVILYYGFTSHLIFTIQFGYCKYIFKVYFPCFFS